MAVKVWPAQGLGAPQPSELDGTAIAVIAFQTSGGDRSSTVVPDRDGDWGLACFVTGAENRGEAREAAADWLGVKKVALLTTKVGGQASQLEVIEQPPAEPPPRVARDWDPEQDEPEPPPDS
jgi:hypothetical protein